MNLKTMAKASNAPSKRAVKRKILNIVKQWEGSKPETRLATEILKVVEDAVPTLKNEWKEVWVATHRKYGVKI